MLLVSVFFRKSRAELGEEFALRSFVAALLVGFVPELWRPPFVMTDPPSLLGMMPLRNRYVKSVDLSYT